MKIIFIFIFILSLASTDEIFQIQDKMMPSKNNLSISEAIIKDYKSFYSQDRLMNIGIGFLGGGLLSNTKIDNNLQNWYQNNIRSNSTDTFSKAAKQFGEGKYLIPIALFATSINFYEPQSDLGVWGVYTSRAYIVGAPSLLLTQVLTGASRPDEATSGSKWKPFNDNNGVSGHAFIGAVPFLTLAHMYEDNTILKYALYTGSLLAAWSRINDNAHYFSQAMLGWYLAYESVNAVFDADGKTKTFSVSPVFGEKSYGVQVQMKW